MSEEELLKKFGCESLGSFVDSYLTCDVAYDLLRSQFKEIERLNKEIKEYQEELSKADSITQSCIFEGKEEATKSYRECLNLLERQHSIIKEVREIFKDYGEKEDIVGYSMYNITGEMLLKLLEILDKENI